MLKGYLSDLARALVGRGTRVVQVVNLTEFPLTEETTQFATDEEIYDVRLELPSRSVAALFQEHGWQIDTGRGLKFPDEWDIVGQACDLVDELMTVEGSAYAKYTRLLVHKDNETPGCEVYLYLGDIARADDRDTEMQYLDIESEDSEEDE